MLGRPGLELEDVVQGDRRLGAPREAECFDQAVDLVVGEGAPQRFDSECVPAVALTGTRRSLLAAAALFREPTVEARLGRLAEGQLVVEHAPADPTDNGLEPPLDIVAPAATARSTASTSMRSSNLNAAASSQSSSAVVKYRYAVATETSARSAASGIEGPRPSRISSNAARVSASRVHARWFARPAVVRDFS